MNHTVLSLSERELIKKINVLMEEVNILKRVAVILAKKLIKQGRTIVLKVIDLNLAASHHITRILHVLKIPHSTYYNFLKWQPKKPEIRQKLIKEKY